MSEIFRHLQDKTAYITQKGYLQQAIFAITTFDYNYQDSIRFPFYKVRLHIIALFVSVTSLVRDEAVMSYADLLSLVGKAAEERDLNTACDDPLYIYLYDFLRTKTTTKRELTT